MCVCLCVCVFTFIQLQGRIRAGTWCCEVVGSCKVQFPTSSQLGTNKWLLGRPMTQIQSSCKLSDHSAFYSAPCFYRAAVMQVQYNHEQSIRPSVHPSVKPVNCDKTQAPSDKSLIVTNRKSTTSFPMRLRWTAYIAPKPPKGAQKCTFWPFSSESLLLLKKVCCKVSLCENFQQQSCKVFTGCAQNVAFYLKFWTKVTHSLQKWRYPIYIHS